MAERIPSGSWKALNRCPVAKERGLQGNVDFPPPVLECHLSHADFPEHGGIVDESAGIGIGGQGTGDRLLGGSGVGQVDFEWQDLAPRAGQLSRERFQLVGLDVEEGQLQPGCRQLYGDLPAKSVRGAGEEHDIVVCLAHAVTGSAGSARSSSRGWPVLSGSPHGRGVGPLPTAGEQAEQGGEQDDAAEQR